MVGPRIVVALDYASASAARTFIDRVTPDSCRLKIGLELYAAAGPQFVEEVARRGFRVFLDLKFHDIPNTVEAACRQAASLGVELLTVHCLGGKTMLVAARRGVGDAIDRPRVLGVTVLTSLDATEVREVGIDGPIEERVLSLAKLAETSGLDGVVSAPTEAKRLRAACGAGFLLVTPGIRPTGEVLGDQRRVLTPIEALQAGADLLVIGRPITQSTNPSGALAAIQREIVNFP